MVATRKFVFPYCFWWVPLLDDSFSPTTWSCCSFAQNYSLALDCLQDQFYTSVLKVPRFCMVDSQTFLTFFLRIHFYTSSHYSLSYSCSFLPGNFCLWLFSPLEISFSFLFLSLNTSICISDNISMWFLWPLHHVIFLFSFEFFFFYSMHTIHVGIYSHTADISIYFMSVGPIFPMK